MRRAPKYGLQMIGVSTGPGTKRTRATLILFLALLFVVAPVLDSFLCSGEALAAQVSLTDDGTDGGVQPILPDSHAACSHGHCHHFTPMPATAAGQPLSNDNALGVAWRSSRIDSLQASSLERPPRA